MTDNDRLIDLDKVVAMKFKGKKIPRFIVDRLKKFIHQDFLNSILSDDSEGVEFCEHTLRSMNVTLEVEGLENVPADGTLYTFASNHPLGGVDGLALCSVIGRWSRSSSRSTRQARSRGICPPCWTPPSVPGTRS